MSSPQEIAAAVVGPALDSLAALHAGAAAAGVQLVARVDLPGAVDVVGEDYWVTNAGQALHIVTAGCSPGYALCGRRVVRPVHPSDHYGGGHICRPCDRAAEAITSA
jgi:hypothetical protein